MEQEPLGFAAVCWALLENALREGAAGRCSRVALELGHEAVRVEDDGPGLPLDPHPQSGRSLLEVILTGPRRGPRNTLARVNASCLWLEAEVARGGRRVRQRYEFAHPTGAPQDAGPDPGRGTRLSCAPARGAPPTLAELQARAEAWAWPGRARCALVLRDPQGGAELVLGPPA